MSGGLFNQDAVQLLIDRSQLNADHLHFKKTLESNSVIMDKSDKIEILQLNITRKCNLRCNHCHVRSGPDRTENMEDEVLDKCIKLAHSPSVGTIDITGGSPEMHPRIEFLIKEVSKTKKRLLVRSNLAILTEPGYERFYDIYKDNHVEIIGSFPHYSKEEFERQRGGRIFDKCIEAVKMLNSIGYGQKGSGLILDLVYNPSGAFMPGDQNSLENEYKMRLKEQFDIDFNNLFCMTNMPLGRFLDYLTENGNYENYITELVNSFNPAAAQGVMCRNTLSVGPEGSIYNCDFNQMMELGTSVRGVRNVSGLECSDLDNIRIITANHCYGCTAGRGSG
ncbi:MAG: arsenosugar biosynthesis radical SAM protein ArsS [Candidatus Delongbacteria bacterium]